MNWRRFLFLGVCIAGLKSPSAIAQDLDSELELKPRTRWTLESGVDPAILECRISERSDIQCVSNTNLLKVDCEGMHYGRRSQAKSVFKGRAFSCEGTRYDKESLLNQWRVRLKNEKGSEAVWIVDAADSEQLKKLFMTELRSLERLPRTQELFFSLGLLGRVENLGAQGYRAGALDLEIGQSPILFDFDFMQLFGSKVEDKNRVRFGLGVVLNAEDAGRGWILDANTGHSVLPVEGDRVVKAWSHCIGPEYRWNPSSWNFRIGGANCWFQKAKISFAPQAHLGLARRISGVFYFTAKISASVPKGEHSGYSVSGPQSQAQLGVSMTLLPD